MTNYYQNNSDTLNIKSEGIRNCQRGAYYATLAWFSRKATPCLIALPTGAGKTALMMAMCFGLDIHRALIITPTDILRSQTYDKFETQVDLKKANAIPESLENPKIFKAIHNFRTKNDWDQCLNFDVTIATPNITSPSYTNVSYPPNNLFDLLIIEVHPIAPQKHG
ncbi:MAG: DEAD/DEAH box helicase family protein [Candidatus Helarchaeota archaeon]